MGAIRASQPVRRAFPVHPSGDLPPGGMFRGRAAGTMDRAIRERAGAAAAPMTGGT